MKKSRPIIIILRYLYNIIIYAMKIIRVNESQQNG